MRLGVVVFISCAALVTLACGPIVMVPGGELSGEVVPAPASWDFTDEVDTVQLETRPSDPYSVNIWALAIADSIYVVAGGGDETTWARHIEADPRVRLRVNDKLYELTAVAANSDADRALFLTAAKKKYDFDSEGENTEKAVLYRLNPR